MQIELQGTSGYQSSVRRLLYCFFAATCLAVGPSLQAATGKVIKVLPHYLDAKGLHAISPSLYDRDAYQAQLRKHPELRSGLRFDVQWKTKGPTWYPLTLRLELRGNARGDLPEQKTMEQTVEPTGWFGKWSDFKLNGADYVKLGEVTAWRVTLWEGDQILGQQQSFLW